MGVAQSCNVISFRKSFRQRSHPQIQSIPGVLYLIITGGITGGITGRITATRPRTTLEIASEMALAGPKPEKHFLQRRQTAAPLHQPQHTGSYSFHCSANNNVTGNLSIKSIQKTPDDWRSLMNTSNRNYLQRLVVTCSTLPNAHKPNLSIVLLQPDRFTADLKSV